MVLISESAGGVLVLFLNPGGCTSVISCRSNLVVLASSNFAESVTDEILKCPTGGSNVCDCG